MKYYFILFIVAISCNQPGETKVARKIFKKNKEEEKTLTDSDRKINREKLFVFLDNPSLKFILFKKGLIEETINFGESWRDIKQCAIPQKSEIGVYAIKYDRYQEFVKHPHANVSSSLLAQVYVYRPTSNSKWEIGDSTEIIFSFSLYRFDINVVPIPRIGTKKSKLINQIGNPEIDRDSIISYYENKEKYKLNIDFHFSNDTLIKVEYNKLKL